LGEKESINVGKSESLWKVGNAIINMVSAMRQGCSKRTENVRIFRSFDSLQSVLHTAVNAACLDWADTASSKWVDWCSKCQSSNRSTTYYGCVPPVAECCPLGWCDWQECTWNLKW
jgi:hypothetical protein